MDILVLHNRNAGDEEPSPGRLLALLRRQGYTPHYLDLHAALESPARLPEVDFIVVAGGDGSFRQAVLKLGARRVPFALLPVGTANNIARSLGIEGGAADVIASWDESEEVPFNVGVVRGPWGEKHFVEGVGIGLFGRIIRILDNIAKAAAHETAARPHRVASDLRATAVLAHEMAPVRVEASLDGEKATADYLLLEALNIGRVGAGAELVSEADFSDDRFELVAAEGAERPKLLETLGNALRGLAHPSRLTVRRVREVDLLLPRCDLRIDDEVVPVEDGTRIEIRVDPDATVQVKVPAVTDEGEAKTTARARA